MALPPGLRHDLPVLVLLVACWLLLPLSWAHVATGLGAAVLVVVHLRTRSRSLRTVLGPRARRRDRLGRVVLLAAAVGTLVSGTARWAGASPESTFHAAVGYTLLAGVVAHVVRRRRALRARLRRPGHRGPRTTADAI